ncbi:3'-5' exonuclease [Vibrio zhugei]|uniref:DNA-directed DNA polymerase n=1 Tax=Vibrio zhugei TaxID=2479546 RepID=A0ABV7C5G1_9VIBR|nr:3'-5' exonuclease [Vibrio zhugei]
MIQSFGAPSIDWPYKFRSKLKLAKYEPLRQFYAATLPEKGTPLREVEFLAMDFETTGLNTDKDEIITIGIVPFSFDRVYLNRARHWTVRPRQKLQDNSVVIHGITHNDIMDAPDLTEIISDVLESMQGKIMVVHFRKIERIMLDKALKRRIKEGIEFPVIDTMEIETRIQRQTSGSFWNRLLGRRPASVRLGQSRLRYNLPPYTAHHALTDAIATAELFQAQMAHHFTPDDPIQNFWL